MRRFSINLGEPTRNPHRWVLSPRILLWSWNSPASRYCPSGWKKLWGGEKSGSVPMFVWSESWCAKFLEGLGGSFRNMYLVYDSCWVSAVPMCQAVLTAKRQVATEDGTGARWLPLCTLAPSGSDVNLNGRNNFWGTSSVLPQIWVLL